MANERLRALLLERRVTPAWLADAVQVDPKTVERWIVGGRVPYRRHRHAVAAFFGVDESYIWPDALDHFEVAAASESEIVAIYPHRWAVPKDTWQRFFEQAEYEIGILAYAATFLAGDAGLRRTLAGKARSGVRLRILLGDPDSPLLILFRALLETGNVGIRLHGTPLHNSICRADEQLLVNTHIYGMKASNAPSFHLRKLPGGDLVSTYLESFERVWESATPCEGA
jgi:hypothetical protein